ncbi:hypothetical protein EON80_25270, partial [bacterium]
MNQKELLLSAARIFEKATGFPVAFSGATVLKESTRSCVLRCYVDSQRTDIQTVILKQIKDDPARGFSDWASLAFLANIPEVHSAVPQFYGGDAEANFYLMEDLGPIQTLEDFLAGNDLAAFEAAISGLAIKMARVSGATLHLEGAFDAIRSGLPAHQEIGHHCEAKAWMNKSSKILDWFTALGCSAPPGFQPSLKTVFNTY